MKQLFSSTAISSKQWLIVVLLFMLSIALRWPNLDRPLSKHHEFVTSVSLRVLQVWEDEGISNLNYSPAMNFSGAENKFIDNHATSLGEMHDDRGNFYYISHPPFAYLLPYACFQLIGADATVMNLQLFHLLIHFLSVIIVIFIARKFIFDSRVVLLAGIIYLFLPATLWFQSNTYMSDMLVHVFFLVGILLFLKLKENNLKWRLTGVLFTLNLFLMIYTSWLGVFFGFVTFCWIALRFPGLKRWILLFMTASGALLALTLTYIQYSSINGSEAFLAQMSERLTLRGSISSESSQSFFWTKLNEIGTLAFNYALHYWYIILLLVTAHFYSKKTGGDSIFRGSNTSLLIITTVPIIVLHFCLLNYSNHDFTVLYASAFFAIFGAIAVHQVLNSRILVMAFGICLLGIGTYYTFNLPGDFSIKGIEYRSSMDQGKTIARQLGQHEVGFILKEKLDPMVILYAHRNIKTVLTEKDAEKWLEQHGLSTGRLFYYSAGELISKSLTLENPNERSSPSSN